MSNPCNEQAGKTQLQSSCFRMLETASSDNEKMAALLLFTHLMKTNTSFTVDPRDLFKAVDVTFLVRLLNSVNVPEGCPELMYKSLAINILSSFTDYDILCHPLLVSNLSSIAEVLCMDKSLPEVTQLFDDSVLILLVFSRQSKGCKHLLKSNCIPIICKAIIQNPELDKLFEILEGILFHLPQHSWAENCSELFSVLAFFSSKFAESQDLLKFSSCEKLVALVSSLCESHLNLSNNEIFLSKWKDEIKAGLNDILQARCKVEYKYTAIKFARYMIELFGLKWTVNSKERSHLLDMSHTKFWFLVLSIIKTEIRLILESGQEGEISSKSDIIVSCYVITEKTIEFLICDKEGWSFDDEVIVKMHSILTETFDCIIQFLIQLDSRDVAGEIPFFKRPIVVATVRVLCVWLSEETNVLSDKISHVLPVLIKWAKLAQNNTNVLPTNNLSSNEILLHLLPPLCHLSADESFCAILIKEECHLLLATLFKQLWQTQQAEIVDYPSHLITLCNILLNFSVLEVELIKTSKAFQDILECIMVSLPQMVSLTLKIHFVLLGMIIFRHRFQLLKTELTLTENDFILNGIHYLKQVHLSLTAAESSCLIDWDGLSELWFLSMQNLVACSKTIPAVKNLVLASRWPEEIKLWMKNCNEINNSLFEDLKSALFPIANLE